MSPNKCTVCGLVNAADDIACRRCGRLLTVASQKRARGPRDATRGISFLYTLLAAALIGGVCYYVITGITASYEHIQEDEAKRLAAQPKTTPAPTVPRSENDQRRAEPYRNSVANSPGLAASRQHNEEVKKLMRPAAK